VGWKPVEVEAIQGMAAVSEYQFIPGLDLCESFYYEVVKPLIVTYEPELVLSAALIGTGSEVIGCDTPMSMDHDWGPRVILFLSDRDLEAHKISLSKHLADELPKFYKGFPTNFSNPDSIGVRLLEPNTDGHPIHHNIRITSIQDYLQSYVGLNHDSVEELLAERLPARVWLTIPEQKLLTLTMGRVFEDHNGDYVLMIFVLYDIDCLDIGLNRVRTALSYYPQDIWVYLMLCCWHRVEAENHLVGRAGFVGDEIGSSIIASRLVRDIMRLCFLIERKYAPYPKWFGKHFEKLELSSQITPLLNKVEGDYCASRRIGSFYCFQVLFDSPDWRLRQSHLDRALEGLATLQASLIRTRFGNGEYLPTTVRSFHDRPFTVISMGEYTSFLEGLISDPGIMAICRSSERIGSIDLLSDNVDSLCDPSIRSRLEGLYVPLP
jgi:hypothetical protein